MNQFATPISDDNSEASQESCVSFGTVQVREYERIVGDHPCVSDEGPPLSLGWGYYDDGIETPIDDFEMTHGPYPYKQRGFQPLNGEARRIILQTFFDVSRSEIREAQKEVARTKKQRNESLQSRGKYGCRIQGVFQSAARCMKLGGSRNGYRTGKPSLVGFLG